MWIGASHTIVKEITHYEHLHFLWASSLDQLMHPAYFLIRTTTGSITEA